MKSKTLFLTVFLILIFSLVLVSITQALEPVTPSGKETPKENADKESQKSFIQQKQDTTDKITTTSDSSVQKEPERKIIAYYFYGDVRCASCKKIEAYSYEAIQTGFKDEIKNGLLDWKTINIDKPENKHFVDDYELYTRSLVIVEFKNGKQTKWKNLDMVWELLKNKKAFIEYVQKEIKDFLKEETK